MSHKATILVTDDDSSIRTVVTQTLTRTGYNVIPLGDGASLMRHIENGDGDLVITDVVLPDANGLEMIPRIKAIRPNLRIIAMSAQTTLMTAMKATEMGAFEYLPKPFDINELSNLVNVALKENAATTYNADGDTLDEHLPIIGRSAAMQDIYRTIARLLNTDLTVLITGESGTGKELVARALHDYGRRRAMPFVALNMAAIPRDLIESELFGFEKGAFSGATQRSAGRFAQAEGGTLFLDEIGDMPIDAQTRLLRVLQEGEFSTVGGRASIKSDVRIVAATHHDLSQLISEGKFREDLFFRLNVVPIAIPPLRERIDDIPELANFFLRKAVEANLPDKKLSTKAEEHLKRYTWPGNVRELENLMQRLTILAVEDIIPPSLVESEIADTARSLAPITEDGGIGGSVERHLVSYFLAHKGRLPAVGLYDRIIREVEKPLISLTLDATGGNQIRAASVLGLNRNTLRKKIRDLNIDIVKGGRR
ncbi:MAG: nitrogen regulation protein NR(I) [Rhodospirillales bacterium]|jgi:two-component system, NtrC family, nitrogen regulation response regulator GlnG|nr:nitrogen regulation protein NR(I) [Rhodospirillales bacterium]